MRNREIRLVRAKKAESMLLVSLARFLREEETC
jgi:hypothetical protein